MNFKPHRSVGGVDERHQCRRCHRTLPWDQFSAHVMGGKLVWEKNYTNCDYQRVMLLHPYCWTCRQQIKGAWLKHPMYSVELDRFWTKAFSGLKGGARSRSILVVIDKDDLLGMYLKQEGRCALSGVKLLPEFGSRRVNKLRPSVDRKDSKGNYTIDNIQIVCAAINAMKNDMTHENFVKWCARVVNQQFKKQEANEQELLEAIG